MRLLLITLFLVPTLIHGQINQRFHENQRPLFEFGVGAINLDIPYYPGSRKNQNRTIPFLWPVYRGKYLRLDQEGTRAKLTDSRFFELGFSLGFSFPINSDDNPVRQGLEDIDYVVEAGPRFIIRLISRSDWQKLNLNLSARAAYEVSRNNLNSYHIGFTGGPSLSYWVYLNRKKSTSLFTSISMLFGDSSYNNFFYGVGPSNTQIDDISKYYTASSGEVSRRIFTRIATNIGNTFQVFIGGFYSDLSHSANINGPLIEQKTNSGFALGFLWNFYQSDQKVAVYGD